MTQDILSVLLPTAQVDFFVEDEGTASTVQALAQDWRFARVQSNVEKTGIEGAIQKYSQYQSPGLVVIETSDIGENFVAQLEQLAGMCVAGTDAVVIGPTNDVHLYRSLIGMGVRDYLVRPVSTDDLVSIVAKSLIDKHGLSDSRLISVIGSKGGSGTTTVAQMVGWATAEKLGMKTTLMDATGSWSGLGISFGLEPSTTLSEATRLAAVGTEDDMKRMFQSYGDHLSVLFCGGDSLMTPVPDADSYEVLVNRVMQKSPVVVVDLSGASEDVKKRMIERSHGIIVVTSPLLSHLRNARTLLKEISDIRQDEPDIGLVVNMQGIASGEEVPSSDIKTALEREPDARFDFQPKVFAHAEASGTPVGTNKAAEKMVAALMPLVKQAAAYEEKGDDAAKEGGGFLGKALGKLKSRK